MTAWDLNVTVKDQPGALANIAEKLGAAGVNIEGLFGGANSGNAYFHFLVENRDSAKKLLTEAGATVVDEREVYLQKVENRVGVLGEYTRLLASAGVNVEFIYLAMGDQLVIGSADVTAVRNALEGKVAAAQR
jgi:hypothetical protein